MLPIVGSISIEVYLISRVILNSTTWALLLTIVVFSLFLVLWIGCRVWKRYAISWRRK